VDAATSGSPWPSPADRGGLAAWCGGMGLRCGGYSGALSIARPVPWGWAPRGEAKKGVSQQLRRLLTMTAHRWQRGGAEK
jgi:hypothetical protein